METIAILVAALSAVVSSVAALIKFQDQRRAKRQQRELVNRVRGEVWRLSGREQVKIEGDTIEVTGDVIEVTIERAGQQPKKIILSSSRADEVERLVAELEHGSQT